MRPLENEVTGTKERRMTETMSQTSESTTTTATTSLSGKSSITNAEELQQIANILGVVDPYELINERFRVDRRKLEQMLLGDSNGETAEKFFQKIMEETSTYITWPMRLKIGAKSKKDPNIKVVGLQENVRIAKDSITQVLDTRQNSRVTMKLDVSYTDHSHIIGKGGLTIKKVMEDTNCHIHFPDSNRSNHQEKSNQVSIAGDMEGVEKARARVRTLTPLIFSFELPIMGSNSQIAASITSPLSTSSYVIKIQEKYNVQVMFRTRPKLHATLVIVKGCEWEIAKVKEATVLLIHHMCENLASQIQIQMTMEISPQHHSVVLGKQNNNLKSIMHRTNTQIMFPDAGDPNIPNLKKSNVTITGSITNVYLARQQLIGSLPLILMFDLPEKSVTTITTDDVTRLMQSLDVVINIRHKPKQSTLSIVIKGIERNANNIYEARRRLLGLEEPKVMAEIPSTYIVSDSFSPFLANEMSNVHMRNSPSPTFSHHLPGPSFNNSPVHRHLSLGNGVNYHQSNWPYASGPSSLYSPIPLHPNHPAGAYVYPPHVNQMMNMQQQQQQMHNNLGKGSMGFGMHLHPNSHSSYASGLHSSLFSMDSKDGSAFSSISSVSSSLSSPTISPRNISPIDTASACSTIDLSNAMSEMSLANNSQSTRISTQSEGQSSLKDFETMTFDYEQKKLLALKAMQTKPNANDYRIPTSVWSGYGFSQTTPSIPNITEINNDILNQTSLWKNPNSSPIGSPQDYGVTSTKDETSNVKITGAQSNYVDNLSSCQLKKITSAHHSDLASLLTCVGLDKYIHLFTSNEIDVATFSSLTEQDLGEIGISAWGAKRKMMLLISEMKQRNNTFSGSAAPGAERKLASLSASSSTSSIKSPTSARKGSLESNQW